MIYSSDGVLYSTCGINCKYNILSEADWSNTFLGRQAEVMYDIKDIEMFIRLKVMNDTDNNTTNYNDVDSFTNIVLNERKILNKCRDELYLVKPNVKDCNLLKKDKDFLLGKVKVSDFAYDTRAEYKSNDEILSTSECIVCKEVITGKKEKINREGYNISDGLEILTEILKHYININDSESIHMVNKNSMNIIKIADILRSNKTEEITASKGCELKQRKINYLFDKELTLYYHKSRGYMILYYKLINKEYKIVASDMMGSDSLMNPIMISLCMSELINGYVKNNEVENILEFIKKDVYNILTLPEILVKYVKNKGVKISDIKEACFKSLGNNKDAKQCVRSIAEILFSNGYRNDGNAQHFDCYYNLYNEIINPGNTGREITLDSLIPMSGVAIVEDNRISLGNYNDIYPDIIDEENNTDKQNDLSDDVYTKRVNKQQEKWIICNKNNRAYRVDIIDNTKMHIQYYKWKNVIKDSTRLQVYIINEIEYQAKIIDDYEAGYDIKTNRMNNMKDEFKIVLDYVMNKKFTIGICEVECKQGKINMLEKYIREDKEIMNYAKILCNGMENVCKIIINKDDNNNIATYALIMVAMVEMNSDKIRRKISSIWKKGRYNNNNRYNYKTEVKNSKNFYLNKKQNKCKSEHKNDNNIIHSSKIENSYKLNISKKK